MILQIYTSLYDNIPILLCTQCGDAVLHPARFIFTYPLNGCSWSDGKIDRPNDSNTPELFRCPHCKAVLWLTEQEKAPGENSCTTLGNPLQADIIDYLHELESPALTASKEIHLRRYIWQFLNNSRRYCTPKNQACLSENETQNLIRLSALLSETGSTDWLEQAEIKRCLKLFDEARILLRNPVEQCQINKVAMQQIWAQQENNLLQPYKDDYNFPFTQFADISNCETPELFEFLCFLDEGPIYAPFSELKTAHILSDREFLSAAFHNLAAWPRQKTESTGDILRDTIIQQIHSTFPWVKETEKLEGIEFDWVIQEYICDQTGDYGFGIVN